MKKTFVGFGFGPIQSALFLLEAFRSGNFSRYVVAEIDAVLIKAVRANRNLYTINIAHADHIEQATIGPIEIYNPALPADRARLIAAIAAADELATALPSVRHYASVADILAPGLRRRDPRRPAILYAAENSNDAAEQLTAALARRVPRASLRNFQCLNTVIGKMSGTITDQRTITRLKLKRLAPHVHRAVLVEAFNHILISPITLPRLASGIPAFIQKPDLLPFEQAKLYGHNAIHALIGYLAAQRGLKTMAEAAQHPDIMATARAAFLNESGAALIRKYTALGRGGEPLFTPKGYRAYADDLLARMVNPNLNDLVARVIRDPARKLAWDDRFYGTMRLVLAQGITPRHLTRGAAAAVLHLLDAQPERRPHGEAPARESLTQLLHGIWGNQDAALATELVTLTWKALPRVIHT